MAPVRNPLNELTAEIDFALATAPGDVRPLLERTRAFIETARQITSPYPELSTESLTRDEAAELREQLETAGRRDPAAVYTTLFDDAARFAREVETLPQSMLNKETDPDPREDLRRKTYTAASGGILFNGGW